MLQFYRLKVAQLDEVTSYGSFILGPLPPGEGITISNTLRRILLCNLGGVSLTGVQLGSMHSQRIEEFSTLPGARESMLDILFNLQEVIFENSFPYSSPQIGKLKVTKKGKIYARDIQLPPKLKIVNPDQYIAELVDSEEHMFIDLNLTIQRGVGSILQKKITPENSDIYGCCFPMDINFSPIKRVNYKIEEVPYASEAITYDYKKKERVIFEIWTNGTIDAESAFLMGIRSTITFFYKFLIDITEKIKERDNILPEEASYEYYSGLFCKRMEKTFNWSQLTVQEKSQVSFQLTKVLNLEFSVYPEYNGVEIVYYLESITDRIKLIDDYIFLSGIQKQNDKKQSVESSAESTLMSISLNGNFEFNTRTRNIFKKLGIETLGQVLKLTKAELLNIKGLGPKSVSIIEAHLGANFTYNFSTTRNLNTISLPKRKI